MIKVSTPVSNATQAARKVGPSDAANTAVGVLETMSGLALECGAVVSGNPVALFLAISLTVDGLVRAGHRWLK